MSASAGVRTEHSRGHIQAEGSAAKTGAGLRPGGGGIQLRPPRALGGDCGRLGRRRPSVGKTWRSHRRSPLLPQPARSPPPLGRAKSIRRRWRPCYTNRSKCPPRLIGLLSPRANGLSALAPAASSPNGDRHAKEGSICRRGSMAASRSLSPPVPLGQLTVGQPTLGSALVPGLAAHLVGRCAQRRKANTGSAYG